MRIAIAQLTALTFVGRGRNPDQRTLAWYPVVGALTGVALSGIWWAADQLIRSNFIVGGIVLLADLLLTGMFHAAGLARSTDSLIPDYDRERRLEIMRQPGVDVFALALVPSVLLLRWSTFVLLPEQPELFIGVWIMSRTLMATAPAWFPHLADASVSDGIVAGAYADGARKWFVVWFIPVALLLLSVDVVRAPIALGLGVFAGTSVLLWAYAKIGGFTIEVLGATAIVAETVALLVLAR